MCGRSFTWAAGGRAAGEVDEEISAVMEQTHQRVRKILSERRKVLDNLAHLLSEKEIVQGEELRQMLSESADQGVSS